MNDLYYFVIMVFKHKNNNVYNKSWQPTVYKWMHVLTLTHTYTPNVTKDPILNSPNIFTYGQTLVLSIRSGEISIAFI